METSALGINLTNPANESGSRNPLVRCKWALIPAPILSHFDLFKETDLDQTNTKIPDSPKIRGSLRAFYEVEFYLDSDSNVFGISKF